MGVMADRRRLIADQPHKATASGEIMIAEPKIERLAVTFIPVQSGSGTPSPSNVRPISGRSTIAANIGEQEKSIALGGSYYGGTVDLVSGLLTVTYGAYTITSATTIEGNASGNFLYVVMQDQMKHGGGVLPNGYCDSIELVEARPRTRLSAALGTYDGGIYYNRLYIWDIDKLYPAITTKAAAIAKMQEIAPTFVFELETPQIVTLTPQSINALRGVQNVSSSAGSVEITYWTK